MNKHFCDFCKNEIPLGSNCTIRIDDPNHIETLGYRETNCYDCCKTCLDKVMTAMGVKK